MSEYTPDAAPTRPGRQTVCVLYFHPLTFQTVRALLTEREFDLSDYRASPDPLPRKPEPAIPDASVHIIEADRHLTSTEAVIDRVSSSFKSPRLLVIGENFEEENAFPLLRLEVRGLVTFAQAPAELRRAVEALASGGFWVPRALLNRFVEVTVSTGSQTARPAAAAELSRRERQVLEAIFENLSNKEIASKLGISERGVKFHVSNLLAKNHVKRRADLILLFLKSP